VLEQEKLALSYEGDAIEDALLPVTVALDRVGNSVKAFSDLLNAAQREFGEKIK
jgi:hypothetical protein